MALSEPAEREVLHNRDIALVGYRRSDGLFDVEARLTDTRGYGFANRDRGWIESGVPLHAMSTRITINEDMVIVAAEAVDRIRSVPDLRRGRGELQSARRPHCRTRLPEGGHAADGGNGRMHAFARVVAANSHDRDPGHVSCPRQA